MSGDTLLGSRGPDPGTAGPAAGELASADVARRVIAFERWRRRSHLVHFYRRALPAAMIAILLFAAGWVLVRSLAKRLGLEGVGTIHMLHPRFYGRNDKGESYVMSATEAVRSGADPDTIALTLPKMVQQSGAPQPQVLTADRGLYHEKARLLNLYGHVRATDGQDNHFASTFAHIDMPRNFVTGQSPMSGYGPSGTISASSYAIYDKGAHIVLTGNVHSHLVNHSTPKPAAQPPAPSVPAPRASAGPTHG